LRAIENKSVPFSSPRRTLERGPFDVFEATPGRLAVDDFRFVLHVVLLLPVVTVLNQLNGP
jgi:hypothetical protein